MTPTVRTAIARFPALVDEGIKALLEGDPQAFRNAVDENFDTRAGIWRVRARDHEMIAIARQRGAAAKFAGSGGAIVAVLRSEEDAPSLESAYQVSGIPNPSPCPRTRTGPAAMKIYVLAAGYATRLYPLTEHCAKPLLEVGGRPILSRILDRALALPDISEVVVIGNQRFSEDLEDWQQDYHSRVPVRILNDGSHSEKDRLGAIRDLAFGIEQVPPGTEDWLVIAGDNLLEFDLLAVQQHFLKQRCPTLVVRERTPEPRGSVTLQRSTPRDRWHRDCL